MALRNYSRTCLTAPPGTGAVTVENVKVADASQSVRELCQHRRSLVGSLGLIVSSLVWWPRYLAYLSWSKGWSGLGESKGNMKYTQGARGIALLALRA